MDTELYQLCKEVYERTGWEGDRTIATYTSYDGKAEYLIVDNNAGELGHDLARYTYLYTSDYLLEKLPKKVRHNGKRLSPTLIYVDEHKWWLAQYYEITGGVPEYNTVANTPLKALLKLVIALDESKELPHAN